ncbi:MAG: hypothetical protein EAX90_12475 [Candidatus Heimdallarchaeota archaeon]|nr:hypothetical protein [Candidatus Heimdallarchaeota archaeon]
MAKKIDDNGIKAIADALKSGGTLLEAACPICDSPLIKVKGRVFCKTCNREVIIYKDEKQLPLDIQKALKKNAFGVVNEDSAIEKTLKGKVEKLRLQLEKTDDTDEIIKISEAIDKLLSTLRKIDNETE